MIILFATPYENGNYCFSSEFCSVWRSCVVVNFLSVEGWKPSNKVLCERLDVEEHGRARERCSSVTSQRKNFGGTKDIDFKRATVFSSRHCLSKHKMTRYARNLAATSPLWPRLATPLVTRKEWKRKNNTYLMFNLPRTKSSQDRQTLQDSDEKQYCQYWALRLVLTN